MSLQEIEAAITKLPARELSQLATWFQAHHHGVWDQQISDDSDAGRLDNLLDEVDEEYAAGLAKPL